MNFLEERIVKDGIVKPGNVLKVDSFLNHQMDVELMDQIGCCGKLGNTSRQRHLLNCGQAVVDPEPIEPAALKIVGLASVDLLLHLCRNAVNDVNAVLVGLVEHVGVDKGLEITEEIAEGEVIGGVFVVELLHKAVAVFKAVLHNALKVESGEGCGGAALAVKKLGLRKNEAKQSKTEDGNTENNDVYYILDLSIHLSLPP